MTRALTAAEIAAYHARRPGITERLLDRLLDDAGANPYEWLMAAIAGRRPVLDLACGSAPLAELVPGRYVGVDRSEAELAAAARTRPGVRLLRADAAALPLREGFAAVSASMALMVLTPLARVLAEVARVLIPGGVLAATMPALAVADGDFHAAVLERLGRAGVSYPEPLGDLTASLARAGLHVIGDEHRRYAFALNEAEDVRLLVESYYGTGADTTRAAALEVAARRATAVGSVGYALRRVVAVRS